MIERISRNKQLNTDNNNLTHVSCYYETFWMLVPLFDAGIIRMTEETNRLILKSDCVNLLLVEVDNAYLVTPGDERQPTHLLVTL